MITEFLSEEESADYWLMFKHFRENKVEIASAVTKPFPFLMSLRDRGYISEQKFRVSEEKDSALTACPVLYSSEPRDAAKRLKSLQGVGTFTSWKSEVTGEAGITGNIPVGLCSNWG